MACTARPMKVSGGQTWLACSELRETKQQRKCQKQFEAYSLQLTICSGQLIVYRAQFTSNVFVSTRPCYTWGLAPPDHCQSWPAAGGAHTTHRGGRGTHKGPQYGGEKKYKEGSRDRSDRSDADLFSDRFYCMVPTSSS